MSFNKVNIGGKFFPPEWFDFDREGISMKKKRRRLPTRAEEAAAFYEATKQPNLADWENAAEQRICPVCGIKLVVRRETGFDRFYDANGLHSCRK